MQTDSSSPQSHARVAALRASTKTENASVMSSALTTRAVALTTRLSASPKVRSEGSGRPGAPSVAGDSPPTLSPAVTRGDMFVLPEDMYGNYEDYETRDNADVHTQSPHLPAQPGSISEQMPVLKPKGETLRPTQETLEHETVTQGSEWGSLWHETTDMGNLDSPVEELCSGKPFDAFTDLKNGSVFAFRGDSRGQV